MRNKARTFCYVSLGILALAAAYHLGARGAGASYVHPEEQGVIASKGEGYGADVGRYLLDNGQVWILFPEYGWRPHPDMQPPVPVSEIKFWENETLVTTCNEGWAYSMTTYSWTNWGPCPGVTGTEPYTSGAVKAKFGK